MKKVTTIFLYTFIALSALWVVFLTLGAFNVLDVLSIASNSFNIVIAFIIVAVGLLLYIGFLFIEKIRNLIIPEWFKLLFYIAFFVFSNVYYLFGLYQTLWGILLFDAYLASLFNILAVSLFYNTQKDSQNTVKTTDKFLTFSTVSYAGFFELIYLFIANIIRIIAKVDITSILTTIVSEISVMIGVGLIFSLMFVFSLKASKQFINSCLIKYNK